MLCSAIALPRGTSHRGHHRTLGVDPALVLQSPQPGLQAALTEPGSGESGAGDTRNRTERTFQETGLQTKAVLAIFHVLIC